MNTRQWTVEELTSVHPLPDGWTWNTGKSVFRVWVEALNESGDCITVDENGDLMWRGLEYIPAALVLPVILASQGLDSREAIGVALEARARKHLSDPAESPGDRHAGVVLSVGLRLAASMVKRGTVQP